MRFRLPSATGCLLAATLCFAPLGYGATSDAETSMADVRQETHEFLETLKSYGAEQRDEAVEETRAALEELDRRLDALGRRIDEEWQQMDAAAREQARESQRELRRQRIELAEWYGSLKNSSTDAWDHMKEGFSGAYQSLQQAWEESAEEFGSDKP